MTAKENYNTKITIMYKRYNDSNLTGNKMKKTRKSIRILTAACCVLALAACSNEDVMPDVTDGVTDNAAQFTGNIERVITRATNTSWGQGDRIGITGTSGTTDYINVSYTTAAGDGNFSVTEGAGIYYQDTEDVDFTAYYPWQNELTGKESLAFSTKEQSRQSTFDWLWASAKGNKAVDKGKVQFQFYHKMSKMVLTVKAGKDVAYTEAASAVCSLDNLAITGTFNRKNGAVTADDESATLTFANSGTSADDTSDATPDGSTSVKYGLILIPQAFTGDKMLTFTANVKTSGAEEPQTFTATLDLSEVEGNGSKNELQLGYQYNILINVNKTGLTVGSCTIAPWTELSHETDATM